MATAKRKKPDYWHKAKRHLSKDAALARIIKAYKGETMVSRGSAFYSLARAIVGQQISVKAADSVWRKLETALGSLHHHPLPHLPPSRGKGSQEKPPSSLSLQLSPISPPPLRG